MEKNMENHEVDSAKETLRKEKLNADESKLLAKEQARTKAYLAREQEIENKEKVRETHRVVERAQEEVREQDKEKIRKEAYQAREKKIAEDMEQRTQKNKNPN